MEVQQGYVHDSWEAKLHHWVVRTLISYSPQWGEGLPHISVHLNTGWGVKTYGFGLSGPHSKGVPVTPYHLRLDITVIADSDSMLGCQRCPKTLLCSALVLI